LGSGLGFRGGPIPGTGGRFLSAAAGGGGRGPEEEKGEREGPAAAAAAAAAAAPGAASPVVMKDVSVNQSKPWLADLGLPSLLPEYAKMLSPSTVFTDIAAGITVGCIAVPLSLAIAVASDVPPEVGLVTAAVSGVAGGLFGGTTLAITGPAAAISLLVVGAVTEHGLEALPFITLACGGMQVASGVTRAGVYAKLVPVSVIAGFTWGVGAMILTGQIPKALGMVAPAGLNPIETVAFLGENLALVNPSAAALALGTAGAMYGLPKIHPKIPSALLAVGGATVITGTAGLDVALIGAIPSGLEAFQFSIPSLPPMESFVPLGVTTFLIFSMTSAESLLSCAALEKMRKTSYKHNPDQELVGQGLANVGAGLFTGMPVTSVIARSGLNVKVGAESRLPALVQSAFVFSSVVFFSESIATIPMPALSGMLILTGMNMLNPQEFKHCFAVEKLDTIPFLTTVGGMIAFGLAEGIGMGCASAWALNYDDGKMRLREMELPHKVGGGGGKGGDDKDHLGYSEFEHQTGRAGARKTTIGWQLKGPVNFTSMFQIDDLIHRIEELKTDEKVISLVMGSAEPVRFTGADDLVHRLTEVAEKNPGLTVQVEDMEEEEKVIVLDMQETTSVEFTGVEELVNRLVEIKHPGTTIEMWNCSEKLQSALDQCDPEGKIERFCDTTSGEAPYHFPTKEAKVEWEGEPLSSALDSPNFRLDFEEKDKPKE
jgi:MFS superfamily sulfate permease-like transporter